VKPGEQVVFTVRAFTSKCHCEWELLVDAVVDGKDQVFKIKNGDQPFRTTAFAKSYETIYSFDFFGGNRFVKLPPGTKFPPPVRPMTAMPARSAITISAAVTLITTATGK
jgi:hypothetical protein